MMEATSPTQARLTHHPARMSLGKCTPRYIRVTPIAGTYAIDPAITRYLVEIVTATRSAGRYIGPLAGFIECGASPRASIAFTNASRALAMIRGRNYVIPEDVKDIAHRVLRHRILLNFEAVAEDIKVERIINDLLAAIRTP